MANEVNYGVRPYQLIPLSKKDKKYYQDMATSIWSDFNRNYPSSFYNARARYARITQYIHGLQNPLQYRELHDGNRSHNKKLTDVNNDQAILNVISKYFRRILGEISSIQYDCVATAIDPLAKSELEEFRRKVMLLKEYEQINGLQQATKALADEMGVDIPQDYNDVEIQLHASKPLQYAMELEMRLQYINYLDKFDAKLFETDMELVGMNCCAMHIRLNEQGVPEREKVPVSRLIVGYSETDDFRDVNEIGRVREISIADLAKENQKNVNDFLGQLSNEELKSIEKEYMQYWDNAAITWGLYETFSTPNAPNYNKYKILVADIYFYDWDLDTYDFTTNKHGNPRTYRNRNGKGEVKTKNKNIKRCSWVIGTNYVYNYGLLYDPSVCNVTPYDMELPIILQRSLTIRNYEHSLVEEMMTIADKAQLYWKKMEQALNRARPAGFMLNIDAFLKAVESVKQFGWTAERALEEAIKNNIVVVSGMPVAGASNDVFRELQGGLGNDFNQYMNGLMSCLQLLESISGFSGAAIGNASQYATKGTSELNMQASSFSIRHIFVSRKRFYERIMRNTCILDSYNIRKGKATGLKITINGSINFIESSEDLGIFTYALMIEDKPTQQEWAKLMDQIARAQAVPLGDGGLSASDVLMINSCVNLKQATFLTARLINRNMRKAQEMQKAMMAAKGEADSQAAQVAAQARMQEMQLKSQAEVETLMALEVEKRKTELLKFELEMEKKKFDALVQSDKINQEGEIETYITEIKAKYNMDRLK